MTPPTRPQPPYKRLERYELGPEQRLVTQTRGALDLLAALIESLPTHSISGYEWECYEYDTGCHYHWSMRACKYGHEVTAEGTYDRDGIRCEHDALLDRRRILVAIDAVRTSETA